MALLCAGCSGKSGESGKERQAGGTTAKKGSYVEEKIELPRLGKKETVMDVVYRQKNILELYTKEPGEGGVIGYYCYQKSLEEKEWKKEEAKGIEAFSKAVIAGNAYAGQKASTIEGEDGNEYILIEWYEGQGKKQAALGRKGTDGKYKKIKLERGVETVGLCTDTRKVLEDGSLALMDGEEGVVHLFSGETGKKTDELNFGKGQETGPGFSQLGLAASGSLLIGRGADKKSVQIYDTQEAQVLESIEYVFEENAAVSFAMGKGGEIYLCDPNGIHRITRGGTLWETIVDSAGKTMGFQEYSVDKLYCIGQTPEEFIGVFENKYKFGSIVIMHYYYDDTAGAEGETQELSVYSLYRDDSILSAVNRFQKDKKAVRVRYSYGLDPDQEKLDGPAINEYIRSFTTELLAGKGADVIILDGLPSDSYIEKGALDDISGLTAPMEKDGELYQNIVDCYKQDRKLYRVPAGFLVPVAIGEREAVESFADWEQTAQYLRENGETPFIQPTSYEAAISLMLPFSYASLFEDGLIVKERLERFMENMKLLCENISAGPEKSSAVERDRSSLAGVSVELYAVAKRLVGDILTEKTKLGVTFFDQIVERTVSCLTGTSTPKQAASDVFEKVRLSRLERQ